MKNYYSYSKDLYIHKVGMRLGKPVHVKIFMYYEPDWYDKREYSIRIDYRGYSFSLLYEKFFKRAKK